MMGTCRFGYWRLCTLGIVLVVLIRPANRESMARTKEVSRTQGEQQANGGKSNNDTQCAQLRALQRPVADTQDKSWPRTGVDFFVLARIEANKLKPSAEASRYTLARRVSLTLTGLPVNPDLLHRFVNETSPSAFEAMVDRVLTSKAHRDYWAIITTHHDKPAKMKNLAQAEAWAIVLWQQVFGQRLKPGSHPQLKDFLARLVQTESDAQILRMLLTSATFRQSAEVRQNLHEKDKDNEWLTRYPLSRLPAWVIARSILHLSGLPNEGDNLVPDRFLNPDPKSKTNLEGMLAPLTGHFIEKWVEKSAAAIACRILTKGTTDQERFRYAALLVIGRQPRKQETAAIADFIRDWKSQYASDANVTQRLTELGIEFPGRLVEAAMWTDITWMLLNKLDFVFRL